MDKYAIKYIKRLYLLCILLAGVLIFDRVATALEVGERAPDFTLPSTTGEQIQLAQFQGKKHVLIQFYTMDYQPV